MEQQFYRYGSTILYDGIFDIDQDIIVSCLVTSPSGIIGNLQTEDTGFLKYENGDTFELNLLNLYDNISIFLVDARIQFLSGGGYSSSCGSFSLSSKGETNERTPLSAASVLIQSGSNNQLNSGVYSGISVPDDNHTIWASRFDNVYTDFVAIAPDKTRGWVVMLSGNQSIGGQVAWESGLSASQGNPWEVDTWYPNAAAKFNTATFSLTSGDSPVFNDWNISPLSPDYATISGNLTTHISQSATLQRFNNPGLGLVRNGLNFPSGSSSPATRSAETSAVSGLIAIATFDRNGASTFGANLEAFPSAPLSADTGNTVSLTATQDHFNVRIPEPAPYTSNHPTSAFRVVGSAPFAKRIPADSDNYEVLRVGFRRRLQDVVLYSKPTDVEPYDVEAEIGTQLATDIEPTNSVRVGLSYRGQMPLALKNLTVNAISGIGEPLI
tara:strand:- start:14160 stop:15479 length:1320 start_codon:yes stop_codon:yes gene_type:complete